jgi:hypothetical protein
VFNFPFTIHAFHADNGSEYINHQIDGLLNKLQVQEFTKSRARKTNLSTGLKTGITPWSKARTARSPASTSVMPTSKGRHAAKVNEFTLHSLSPCLDFHRPCFFP